MTTKKLEEVGGTCPACDIEHTTARPGMVFVLATFAAIHCRPDPLALLVWCDKHESYWRTIERSGLGKKTMQLTTFEEGSKLS